MAEPVPTTVLLPRTSGPGSGGGRASAWASGAVALGGLLAVALAAQPSWLAAPAWWTFDRGQELRAWWGVAGRPGEVAVVGVDQYALEATGETFPFNRRRYAALVDELARDGARAVALDLFLYTRRDADPEQDDALARSMAASGRVVLATFLEGEGAESRVELPRPEFVRAAAGMGYARAEEGSLGVSRELWLYGHSPAAPASLALEALRVFWRRGPGWAAPGPGGNLELRPADDRPLTVPLRAGRYVPDFAGTLPRIPEVSFARVLRRDYRAGEFRGKLVFVGATAPVLHDVFDVPSRRGVGGVYLHACAADELLAGRSLRPAGAVARVALTLLAALVGTFLASRERPLPGLLGCLCLGGAGLVLGAVAQGLGVRLDVLPLVAGPFGFYLAAGPWFAVRAARRRAQVIEELLRASRAANVAPELLAQIDQTFGLRTEAAFPRRRSGELPSGLGVVRSLVDGAYENVELVGKGGMGLVVRADDRRTGRTVAIKLLAPALAADAEALRRFEREVDVLERLEHPNIVRVLGRGGGDVPWLVMEYLVGESLRAHLNRSERLDRPSFLAVFDGVLAALAHAHGRGVVHRDLKPENVFLDAELRAKVLDFGLAHVAGASQLTRSGMLLGTFRYMAPEQKSDGEITPRTDVYAVGVLMLECLLGSAEFVRRFGNGLDARPVPTGLPAEWGAFQGLLARCLDVEPVCRPADMGVVYASFNELQRLSGESAQETVARRAGG